jgi:hypothetical protein
LVNLLNADIFVWVRLSGFNFFHSTLPSITLFAALLCLPWWNLLTVRKELLCLIRHVLEGAIYLAGEDPQYGNRGKRD